MKRILGSFILITMAFSQDEIELSEGFSINVEPEKPRVQMISTREKPDFPEVPIFKSFFENIIDKNRNYVYATEQKKVIMRVKIDQELNQFK